MSIPIKPSEAKFTDAQWRAIYEEGKNILVSASAGSGKTTVLTQRIVEKVKRGITLDKLIVVTYTESAAREMRERIEKALKKEVNQMPDATIRRHLQTQIALLPQANISTIHAFCLKLIREHFQAVNLDPVFRLITDETEISLLKDEVWQNLKEQLYTEKAFRALAKAYSSDKYDTGLDQLIFSLYDFSRASENPKMWLDNLSNLYAVKDLSQSQLFVELVYPNLVANVEEVCTQLQQALELIQGEGELQKASDLLSQELECCQLFCNKLQEHAPFDELYHSVKAITFERWKGAGKNTDESIKEVSNQAKDCRNQAKSTIKELQDTVFSANETVQIDLLEKTRPFIDEMAKATKCFADAYQAIKLQDNVLEFSDLEHITLSILAPLQNGIRQASAVSEYFRQHLHEVMVDEYQDVNRLQETILSYLTNGQNLFMVGDVKQSIYSFRLADPSLFLEKYLAYGKHQGGERIILAENFRSRGNVLQATNFIFEQIMDTQVGQMIYDKDAMLVQGNQQFGTDEKYPLELLLYETDQGGIKQEQHIGDVDEQFVIDGRVEGEIAMVAERIQQLIANRHEIMDNGQKRPVTYQDIVLLVPTKKNNVVIQEIFNRYHIPVFVNESETYFQRTEIMIMLSLLKIIDNPYQDIPLVSVLRSPIVQLDENDLAAIRINQRTGDYYIAVLSFIEEYREGNIVQNDFNQAIYDKLVYFLEQLEQWRFMAHKESLGTLIWKIYQDTYFLDYVVALPSGKQRQVNLHALYEHAKAYEKMYFKGLFQFVRFIEKMQEKERDLAEIAQISHDNVVQIMTIHASKGLEFPIVFVLDMAKQFNKTDLRQAYIFTEEYGIGIDYFDSQERWRYPTLARLGMLQYKERKLLAEEMRKLYVALTRAKEQLFLVGSCDSREHYWKQLAQIVEHREVVLPTAKRLKASSLLSWISMALVRHQCATNDYLGKGDYPLILAQSTVQFSISFHQAGQLTQQKEDNSQKITLNEWLNQQLRGVESEESDVFQQLDYRYPFQQMTRATSYQSVSELKRLVEDPDQNRMENLTRSHRYVTYTFKKPQFMIEQQIVIGAMIGTAVHLFMQTVPLKVMSLQRIEEHLHELVAKQLLEKDIASQINRQQLLQFFASEFGEELLKKSEHVKREVPFSLMVQAKLLFPSVEHTDEKVLVHGIVDGYIEEEDGIVLYDFKTDDVNEEHASHVLKKRYSEQLSIYAHALEHILHKPVKKIVLCALSVNQMIVLDKSELKAR